MMWVAWKMLTGNRAKYIGIISGITFAALLIAQQASIFWGLMNMTTSQIQDIRGADIWVMDSNMQFIDDIKPMADNELYRVRGVSGVQWAVRLYKGITRARLPSGNFQQVIMIGLDDATMVGAPNKMILGSLEDLRQPDSIIMDEAGFKLLWPDEPYSIGKSFEMNDRRAVIVGICDSRRTFMTFPIVYTRYTQATLFSPMERKVLSFVLAQGDPKVPIDEVCRRITAQTGLKAMSREDFYWTTIVYYMRKTGIPINFGITVLLGFIVGTAIAGQTFYMFTIENLKQFGTLKAMGAGNLRLMFMIMLQAVIVGLVGYGIGVGMAAGFGEFAKTTTKLAFQMHPYVLAGTGVAVMLIVLLSSLLSLRRVLVLEPAIVFQG